jgi:hypothetical protein
MDKIEPRREIVLVFQQIKGFFASNLEIFVVEIG